MTYGIEHDPAATRFAILASGRGSNAQALMRAFESGFIPAHLVLVFSNNPQAPVLTHAEQAGIPTASLPHRGMSRVQHEGALLTTLRQHRVQHLLLAGYMRILSPFFLGEFRGRILNIHPSLLPAFPGLEGAERQWDAGMKVAGATVHFVDEGTDSGEVLLQGSLEVRGDEGREGLAQRILHEVEHVIYPRAVRLLLDRIANPMGATPQAKETSHD